MFDLYDSITAGFAGGVLAAASMVSVLISVASYVLIVIGWWKIFTKAGEAGWKSLIPFYNGYTISKICWETKYFWFTILASVAGGIFSGIGGIIGGLLSFRCLHDYGACTGDHAELQAGKSVRPRRRLHLGADLYSVAVRADPRLRQLRVSGQGRINSFFRALSVGTCEKPRTDIPCAAFFIRL